MSNELLKDIEEVNGQLREKLSSKFQTAVFLVGFSITLLGIEISMLWGQGNEPPMLSLAIPALIFAVVLYGMAIMLFDGLTMPKAFWPLADRHDELLKMEPHERLRSLLQRQRTVLRVEDLVALKAHMVFYWSWLVVAALLATAVSLAMVLVPSEVSPSWVRTLRTDFNAAFGLLFAVGWARVVASIKRGPYGKLAVFD